MCSDMKKFEKKAHKKNLRFMGLKKKPMTQKKNPKKSIPSTLTFKTQKSMTPSDLNKNLLFIPKW